MPAPVVVVTRKPPGEAIAILDAAASIVVWPEDSVMPRSRLLDAAPDAIGIYSMLTDAVDRELLDAAPDLMVVSNMAVGVDNVDLVACTERGIPVGHTPDVLTETTADTAFALLLAAARRIVEGVDHVRQGLWLRWEPELLWGTDVHSSVLGIVGLGRIGSAVARRGLGFGMRVVAATSSGSAGTDAPPAVELLPLHEVLSAADHLVVAVPLTEHTRHLIDASALTAMKPTATLVNISRGPVVDHDALALALAEGTIAAAGLDVTEPEPLPSDHPLVAMSNCVVIPHLGSSSRSTRVAMAELAARNLVAGLAGVRIEACANPEVYDG
jgi:glyoxylate reductase